MGIGVTHLTEVPKKKKEQWKKIPIGEIRPDPFFDSYTEERLICSDILDRIGILEINNITLTFNKQFLRKIIHSHIQFIKYMRTH